MESLGTGCNKTVCGELRQAQIVVNLSPLELRIMDKEQETSEIILVSRKRI